MTCGAIRYFVLSHELRQAIWEETNLRKQKVHQHMFDYDDFVVKAREAVRAWTRDRYTNAVRTLLNVAIRRSPWNRL